jgi:hypothetical protein
VYVGRRGRWYKVLHWDAKKKRRPPAAFKLKFQRYEGRSRKREC